MTHVRDGFLHTVRRRIQAARKTGVLDREQEEVRTFRQVVIELFLFLFLLFHFRPSRNRYNNSKGSSRMGRYPSTNPCTC